MSELARDEYEIKFDVFKSDMFIIGLVALEMASLKFSDRYYNYHIKAINMDRIRQELSALKGVYSVEFLNILSRMLEENPDGRPDFEWVLQYTRRLETTLGAVRESKGIKLTEDESITQKRKVAIENRRQQLLE